MVRVRPMVFVDTEVGVTDEKIHDIGAVRSDGAVFHSASVTELFAFSRGTEFICGHNIVHHDWKYLMKAMKDMQNMKDMKDMQNMKYPMNGSSNQMLYNVNLIDTLYLSPLLFPQRPYHRLLKDDKLQVDALNNPVNDCKKAERLFWDEVNAFESLPSKCKQIYCHLLYAKEEFRGFFEYVNFRPYHCNLPNLIQAVFAKKICANAKLIPLIRYYPVELAYALALIGTGDYHSITPPWLLRNYPKIENVMKYLRHTSCEDGCEYCKNELDVHKNLNDIFGYDSFRTYNGEPLQENAAKAAVDGKSLLAVFPTGGGKSITFQLPALMAGRAVHGLTVVISPLQSLMKDQVDNLNQLGITDAVTVNGMLDPIERANALAQVSNGSASLLYISPEQLRSRTIEKMLLSRNIVRFVIDEAHCFSAWGQDFRVDYLYIGDFIRELQEKKRDKKPIPVSCFTATAKQKVITDICDYFKRKLNVDLEIFASTAARENLHYTVIYKETEEEKYTTLRNLIVQKNCPTIVYVSRTKRTRELAERLSSDGFSARPFNGKMDANDKILNQEAFIRNEVNVMVATSAFGMGVDKKDVKLVVHYDISSSLEDYVQEAGRAGRDPSMQAECYVLYNDNDLDKHFILLNQTKLSISEIQQVWRAIKELTKMRPRVCCSSLEIARQAGWDDSVSDVETRVRTAISALENAGYVKRGRNVPHVYATSILAKDMREASFRIDQSALFSEEERTNAKRIIKSLISSRSIAKAQKDDAESRVDYLADTLGMTKEEVISTVNLMRQDGLLADSQDMSAYILSSDTENKSKLVLERFAKLEQFLLRQIVSEKDGCELNLKELNEAAQAEKIAAASVKNIRTLFYYYTIKNYIRKEERGGSQMVKLSPVIEMEKLEMKYHQRMDICRFILESLYVKVKEIPYGKNVQNKGVHNKDVHDRDVHDKGVHNKDVHDKEIQGKNVSDLERGEKQVEFSVVGLYQEYTETPRLDLYQNTAVALSDIEDALLYLSKIGALKLEGGFLVLYNGMEIKRLVKDNRIQYKVDDYRFLDEFYKQKIRQIHIVGEYANLMVRDYDAALQFVQDYFQMDFKKFITKYFKGERAKEIDRNITPEKYRQLFGDLSEKQAEIIHDADSKYIVVAAGPGSGKTRVLVHKLASLLLLEDVKHEQLLMLTFSRAAATEFKKRLIALIGNAASFVEIKTFHSYCFDLLGKVGSLEGVEDVVKNAADMICNGEVEPGRIAKSVLVIDEAQDMDKNDFALVCALMQRNDTMRVIAVGDDDQNIYEFRGSDSKYLGALVEQYGAVKYEMTENYRSKAAIVSLANAFATSISSRMKTVPVKAVQDALGRVLITHHSESCRYMEEAVAEQIASTRDCQKSQESQGSQNGQTNQNNQSSQNAQNSQNSQTNQSSQKSQRDGRTYCILTQKNDEALQILGLLIKRGIRAKLIQSLDGFRLYNLIEIRYFLYLIDCQLDSPVISNTLWTQAKKKLFQVYSDSSSLEICRNLIREFESVSPVKYRRDLEEFINESNYEDFYDDDREAVTISTIHKAKGREFDEVYLLLNRCYANSDDVKRKLYVGMTRAKNALYIHCNTDLFQQYRALGSDECKYECGYECGGEYGCKYGLRNDYELENDYELRNDYHCGIEYEEDSTVYEEPKELSMQLTHRDVVLDFFKGKKRMICRLHSGAVLSAAEGYLGYLNAEIDGRNIRVVKFSKAFREKVEKLKEKGFEPYKAVVHFMVVWKGEEDKEESVILLPTVNFRR